MENRIIKTYLIVNARFDSNDSGFSEKSRLITLQVDEKRKKETKQLSTYKDLIKLMIM